MHAKLLREQSLSAVKPFIMFSSYQLDIGNGAPSNSGGGTRHGNFFP
jgi:hypothetical protein